MSHDSSDQPADSLPFVPVVIIGAGRSGTNSLRDMLTRLPDFSTWPCDEVNPIWRHGNVFWPNDEIPPECARPSVRLYVRRAFLRLWKKTGKPGFIVEKTCANSLRVPFVDAVLPEAKYIWIVRNGIDVVASACKRWQGELEVPGLRYFLAKARYAPVSDLPLYGFAFLKSRLARVTGRDNRLGTWGPRFAGIDDHTDAELEEVCARQWAACIERSNSAFEAIGQSRVLKVHYEDFTTQPDVILSAILSFLGAGATEQEMSEAIEPVRSTSIGKGQFLLGCLRPEIIALIESPMREQGYVE